MKTLRLLAGLLLLTASLVSPAQTNWPGYLDPGFTATCVSNAAYNQTVRSLVIHSDGKMVGVGGFQNSFAQPIATCENGVFRCDSNGIPDGTFHSPFTTLPDFQAIVAAPGGKYLVAGSVFLNNQQVSLARLNANGSLDGTFTITQTNPPGGSATAFALALDSSNRIVVAGYSFVTTTSNHLRRLTAHGAMDPGFTPPVVLSWSPMINSTLAVQPDNKILVGGYITNVNGAVRIGLARLNENGTLDTSFNPPFQAQFSLVAAIRLLPNGQMYVTGQFGTNANPGLILARLNADGSIDPTFPPVPSGVLGVGGFNGTAIALQPDGRVVFTHGSGASRVSASGVVDTNFFRGAGTIALGNFRCAAADAAGRILVGGEFMTVGSTSRRGLFRLFGGDAPIPTPPSIQGQPADQTAFAGGSATFSLTASGSAPLSYHWYFGGLFVGGGGSPSITFNSLLLGQNNSTVYCIVTNQYGRATSSVVRLFVQPAPVAPGLVSQPVSVSVTNPAPPAASDLTEANLRGRILRLHILGGAAPFPVAGDYDLVLGPGNNYLIPAGGAMGASAGTWSFGPDLGIDAVLTLSDSFPGGGAVKLALLPGGLYELYADGVVNNQHGTYRLYQADGSPVGATVTFGVVANGTAPLAYQWWFNNTPLAAAPGDLAKSLAAGDFSGTRSPTLTVRNVDRLNAGRYVCVISNVAGVITSAVATLTVDGSSGGGAADTLKPKLNLLSPAVALKTVGSNSIRLTGTASDNLGLAAVSLSVNGGIFLPVSGLSNWSAMVGLSPGTNLLRVRAVDLAGNAVTNLRSLTYLPALGAKGNYSGLFFDTNAPSADRAGAVSLTVKPDVKFSGKLRQGAASYSFSGTFGTGVTASVSVPRPGLSSWLMTLRLEGTHVLGTVTDITGWNAALEAVLSAPVGALAGKYNVLLPGRADAAAAPGGDGYVTLTVATSGRVSGSGSLADGSPLSVVTSLSPDGFAPVYQTLTGGGTLFGWWQFQNRPESDVAGALFWTKPPAASAALYPGGFSLVANSFGARLISPPAGQPALSLSNGVVLLRGGNLASPLTVPITLGTDNRITGSNQISLILTPAKGSFTGSFVDPANGAKRVLKGLILGKPALGGGYFLGSSESGEIYLGEAP